jgi:hypothetical protein
MRVRESAHSSLQQVPDANVPICARGRPGNDGAEDGVWRGMIHLDGARRRRSRQVREITGVLGSPAHIHLILPQRLAPPRAGLLFWVTAFVRPLF